MQKIKAYVGVDLGGTNTLIALYAENDILVEKVSFSTNLKADGSYIIPEIVTAINVLGSKYPQYTIVKTIIAIPGVVDAAGYTKECVNLGWKNKNIKQEFKELSNISVDILNDANAAALGENFKGASANTHHALMVTLGTGVGSGIVVNGQVLTGHLFQAGELGHIQFEEQEKVRCACGQYNCLETYVSSSGILKRNPQYPHVKSLFDHAKKGDREAISIIETQFHKLSLALLNYTIMFSPEVIVIGGGIANAGEMLIEMIVKGMQKTKPDYLVLPQVKLAKLKDEAGLWGCIYYAMQQEGNK
ncbi:MAG TPA: ROK family protein [Erysipelothrix sp.]